MIGEEEGLRVSIDCGAPTPSENRLRENSVSFPSSSSYWKSPLLSLSFSVFYEGKEGSSKEEVEVWRSGATGERLRY